MPLTALAIKHLKPSAKLYRVADSGGLCLEVTPSGSKLWRWRYKFEGKQQMLALGQYPATTLEQARKKRDEAKLLVQQGKHPTREKKAQKLRKALEGELTFEWTARHWFGQIKQLSLNAKYSKQCLVRMEQHVFPTIGNLPIKEITTPDVVRVIEAIAKRGTIETAKRMKQLIGQIFNHAIQRGLCDHNPAASLQRLLPRTAEKHHACINEKQLPTLLHDIESSASGLGKIAIELLALTFVRTNELIAAKWEEIDWHREEWRIPSERMKMRKYHIVPLSKQSLALLRELHRVTGSKPYLFFSAASKSHHISNGTILMALRRMGYGGRMTGHGFRTLASTTLNEQGYNADVIERQLAHAESDASRGAYNRAEYMPERKKMMQDYADYLDTMRTASPKVIDIKPAASKEEHAQTTTEVAS